MAVSKTKSSVTNFPTNTRRGTLTRDTPVSGGGTDPAPSTIKTTISGSITFGTDKDKITVPVQSILPPPAGTSVFVFHLANDPSSTTKIPVGEFIQWAISQLNVGSFTLPTSLTNFTVAIETLDFDTGGNFDIKVELGSGAGDQWKPTWQPLGTSVPLSLDNVTLEVAKGTVAPKPTS